MDHKHDDNKCPDGHCHHCDWVDEQIGKAKEKKEQWDKVYWTALATVIGGLALTAIGALVGFAAWLVQMYVQSGVK